METPNIHTLNVKKIKPPKIPIKNVATLILLALAAIILWNSWFTVEPEEVGVVLRFGKYVREAAPGLNFKMPDPIETVIKVPVQRQLKEEFGFRTLKPGVNSNFKRNYKGESLMLTGDLNVAVVEWSTQYRVRDPYLFLFKVKAIRTTFRDMNEAVMREVIGDRSVDHILTVGRQEIAEQVKIKLQKLCNQYETGIAVDQIVLQNVTPPDPVKPSFNEVNQAQQEREKMINDALAEYNRVIPRAKGEALKTIQQAEGYAADRINRAKGDAAFFDQLLKAYSRSPEVTRKRIYLETMERIYGRIQKKYIFEKDLKSLLPLLSLDKEVTK